MGVGFEFLQLRGEEGGFDTSVAPVEQEKVRDIICLDLRGNVLV